MEYFTFEVSGAGMGAALAPGDRVKVHRSTPETFKPGDLIVFLSGWQGVDRPKRLAVHRLIFKMRTGKRGWRLWAKPDARWRLNGSMPGSCVLGKVVAISRDGTSWAKPDRSRDRALHCAVGLLAWPFSFFRRER